MRRSVPLLAVLAAFAAAPAFAKVTRITITGRQPTTGTATIPYEVIFGLADGELDPRHPLNAIIQDIQLAPRNARGNVEYTATFQIIKPVDMAQSSHLMFHDVANRGRRAGFGPEKDDGDVDLSSGWQGDNSGTTAQDGANALGKTNEWVRVPVAVNPDGSPITGTVLGRIVNRSGPASQAILVQSSPLPYKPFTLDTAQATLSSRGHESMTGVVSDERNIAASDWAWARCSSWADRVPDPTQICLKDGFDGNRLYEVVFTARDPFVLGMGFAAFRDVESFFKFETADASGNSNPLAGQIRWSISRGVSQSGNFLRGWLHLGFNQDEAGRRVSDGMWPIIAGRRIALNFRWAQPDGVLELYEAGSEGPQWWSRFEDHVRGLPARGILDRCSETRTCPKIIEHFGAAEVWELKLPIEWVGTDAEKDIPLPENVRRYYIASTTHGGTTTPAGVNLFEFVPANPSCPGNNWGRGVLPGNPVPHTQPVNAIREHFRAWVMNGTRPPDNLYPRLRTPDDDGDDHGRGRHEGDGDNRSNLVLPKLAAMGFPRGIPGLPATVPEAALLGGTTVETPFINPVLDYDWGRTFNPSDGSGVPANLPPPIKQVIKMLVPRVDADGNELGGVPSVLRDAPLGSYFGWNITAAGFHKDQNCDYTGGMVPFARTKAERLSTGDPRLSLEERYGTHDGYVAAVRAAAANAMARGFLLPADADDLIAQAASSHVLSP